MDADEPSGSVNKGDHTAETANGRTVPMANVHVDCVIAVMWSWDRVVFLLTCLMFATSPSSKGVSVPAEIWRLG